MTSPIETSTMQRTSGFTLLELIISLAIFGLMLTVAFGSLNVGSRSWARGVNHADAAQDIRSGIDFLRQQLAQTLPKINRLDGDHAIAFIGESNYARFIAPAPAAAGGGGLVAVTLAIDRTSDGISVLFGVSPVDPGVPILHRETLTLGRELFSDLTDATITYFGAPSIGDDPAWHREWKSNGDTFPIVVRLTTVGDDVDSSRDHFFRIRAEEPL